MLEIKNLDQVERQLDRWYQEAYADVTEAFRGLTVTAFHEILHRSAQYSGDFAANWNYSIGAPDYSFTPNVFGGPPVKVTDQGRLAPGKVKRIMGNTEAISYAIQNNRRRSANYKLGDVVYITNSANHDEPYAIKIEEGKIKFRDGNQGAPVARTLDLVRANYQNLDRGKVNTLKRKTL